MTAKGQPFEPRRVAGQLRDSLFRLPDGLPQDYARVYALGKLGYPLGLAVHAFYLAIFWYLDLAVLAAFNVLSVAIFAIAWRLHARGDVRLPFFFALIGEIPIHAILATLYIGFASAFGLHLFSAVAVTLLVPFLTRPMRLVISGGLVLALVMLGSASIASTPMVSIPAGWVTFLFAFNTVAFSTVLILLVAAYDWAVIAAEDALQKEYDRAEMLLENILPVEIAARLKEGEGAIADEFSEVTILFADIVDFTTTAARLSPSQVIGLLNGLFSEFDDLVASYGLEKIKTIGDAYMVVAGLPKPRPDHATAMAGLALDMLAAARRHKSSQGVPLDIRIGMNCGPVVAGVIGHKKFAYDLWGDAVNVAARMEAYGEAGCIQLTDRCRALIDEEFICRQRGEVEIKGKGMMRTHFLVERRSTDTSFADAPHSEEPAG